MDMGYFLKKFNIKKYIKIALIFMLIGVVLSSNPAYSSDIFCLRVPVGEISEEESQSALLEILRNVIQRRFQEETGLTDKMEWVKGRDNPKVPLYRVKSIDTIKGLEPVTNKRRLVYRSKSTVIKGGHYIELGDKVDDEIAFSFEGKAYSEIFNHFKNGLLAAPIALVYDEANRSLYYVEERLDYSFRDKIRIV